MKWKCWRGGGGGGGHIGILEMGSCLTKMGKIDRVFLFTRQYFFITLFELSLSTCGRVSANVVGSRIGNTANI